MITKRITVVHWISLLIGYVLGLMTMSWLTLLIGFMLGGVTVGFLFRWSLIRDSHFWLDFIDHHKVEESEDRIIVPYRKAKRAKRKI